MSILVFIPAAAVAVWWLTRCGLGLRRTHAGLLVMAVVVGAGVAARLHDIRLAAHDAKAAQDQQAVRAKVDATLASWARPDFIRHRRYPELVTAAGEILHEMHEAVGRNERAAPTILIKEGTLEIRRLAQLEDMLGFLKLEGCDVPPATALAARAILVKRSTDFP
jgi:hypothetical protein